MLSVAGCSCERAGSDNPSCLPYRPPPPQPCCDSDNPHVSLDDYGVIAGYTEHAIPVGESTSVPVAAFLGIKYGTAKRWRDARYYKPLTPGTSEKPLSAVAYGKICPQSTNTPGVDSKSECSTLKPDMMSEDCLFLNIWTPRPDPGARLPVMVFIHGGAFILRAGSQAVYDGARMAATRTDITSQGQVVVTLNYRLGALGFLNGRLGDDVFSGNYGITDQMTALCWIRNNIARFGGDPDNVTIFGESAGAMSVGIHLYLQTYGQRYPDKLLYTCGDTDSENVQLFQRGIMESNPYGIPYKDQSQSQLIMNEFVRETGCRDRKCLEACPLFGDTDGCSVVRDQKKTGSGFNLGRNLLRGFLADFLTWAPVINPGGTPRRGWIPDQPNAHNSGYPFIAGTNTNEALIFVQPADKDGIAPVIECSLLPEFYELFLSKAGIGSFHSLKKSNYAAWEKYYGDCCKFGAFAKPYQCISRMVTDLLFTCPTRHILRNPAGDKEPSAVRYGYYFTHIPEYNPLPGNTRVCGKKTRAVCHADELPWVFQNPVYLSWGTPEEAPAFFTPDGARLSRIMSGAWIRFARKGDPNDEAVSDQAEKIPVWPAYEGQRFIFDFPYRKKILTDDRDAYCDIWDKTKYDFSSLMKDR